MEPLVTIVIPSRDSARYLGSAIDSALSQTHQNTEVLVLDDASGDDSAGVVRSFQDERIRFIVHPEAIGDTRNYNEGFRRANGDFITFLAPDNCLLPTYIEDSLAFRAAHPYVDCTYASVGVMDAEGEILRSVWEPAFEGGEFHSGRNELGALLTRGNYIFLPTVLFPASLAKETGPLDESLELRAFHEYYLRIAAAGKRFGFFAKPQALVRVYTESTSDEQHGTSKRTAFREYCTLVGRYAKPPNYESLAGYGAEIAGAVKRDEDIAHGESFVQSTIDAAEQIPNVSPIGSTEPLISIVMPYSGRLGMLAHALDTIAGQGYAKWEAIVVADGAPDPSGLITRMGLNDRVRVAKTGRPCGPGAARRLGLSCVSGEIVAYLDDDNRFEAGYLGALARAFRDPSVMATSGNVRIAVVAANGSVLHVRETSLGMPEGGRASLVSDRLPLNAVAHRRSCVAACGTFNPDFPLLEDWEFLIRLSSRFTITHISKPACILCFDSRLDGHELFSRRTSAHWGHFVACLQEIYNTYAPRTEPERSERAAYAQNLQSTIQAGVRSAGKPLAIMEFVERIAGL